MGIENRDYTRDGDYTGTLAGWGLEYVSPIVKWLIGINIAVFLLQIFLTRSLKPADIDDLWRQQPPPMQAMYLEQDRLEAGDEGDEDLPRAIKKGSSQEPTIASADSDRTPPASFVASVATERVSIIDEWFALRTSKAIRGQVWRLVTYAFCHSRGELFHILLNMLGLFWFGVTLESMYGGKEFLLFYLTAAVAAGLASIGLDVWLGWDLPTVGASGAVMAVLVLYAIHYPRNTIRFFWFFPLEVRWVVLLYLLFDLHPVLLALAGNPLYYDRIGHAAHLGGLAFGFAYWKLNLNLEQYWDMLPKPRAGGLRVSGRAVPSKRERSAEQQLEEEVDSILAKISVAGADSLTDKERRTLAQASERYRRKHG